MNYRLITYGWPYRSDCASSKRKGCRGSIIECGPNTLHSSRNSHGAPKELNRKWFSCLALPFVLFLFSTFALAEKRRPANTLQLTLNEPDPRKVSASASICEQPLMRETYCSGRDVSESSAGNVCVDLTLANVGNEIFGVTAEDITFEFVNKSGERETLRRKPRPAVPIELLSSGERIHHTVCLDPDKWANADAIAHVGPIRLTAVYVSTRGSVGGRNPETGAMNYTPMWTGTVRSRAHEFKRLL